MSEEIKKISVIDAFRAAQQTFAEAEEKAKQEAGSPRVERFRIGEDGEYSIRILPLAPSFDGDGKMLPMERTGYEYPVHQQFLAIELPAKKGGKAKKINIPVIRTTDKGVDMSVDLIDTYVKIAKEMYADDEELIKLVTGGNFGGGLRWGYQHAIYVLDLSSDKERAKGPQLWQCSHSQYKDIDSAKMRLWRELREDGEQETCPISGFEGAYPIKVIRANNNGQTSYTIEIGRKTSNIKEEELDKLLELPRIPEQIYRYTRYQMEATVEFLKQYDEKHDMEVCKETDFIEAVEKLKGELSADDTSHFDIAGAAKEKSEAKDDVTIDSLWDEYDYIVDQELDDKSAEYQELREKIRQFVEDEGLDIRLSRTKNNQQLLTEVEEALDSASKKPVAKKEAAEEKREEVEKHDEEAESEDGEKPEETPAPKSRRRPRPGTEDTSDQEEPKEPEEGDAEAHQAQDDGTSRRRLRNRRMR